MRVAATAIMMAASTKALTRGAFNRLTPTALLGSLLGANGDKYAGAVMGTEDIMKPKAHGMSTACIRQPFEWRSIVEPAVKLARRCPGAPNNPSTAQARPRRPSRRT